MGEGDLHYFLASSGVYCYDDYMNVWSEDGTLVNDGLLEPDLEPDSDDQLPLTPSFRVDGIPYWPDSDGLFCQDTDGTYYAIPIHTVQSEQEWSRPAHSQEFDRPQLPQQDIVTQATCGPDLLPKTPTSDKPRSPPAIANFTMTPDEQDPYGDLFGNALVHPTNHDRRTGHDSTKNKLPPPKPDLNKKYYFDTPRGMYYYDAHRKLYTADGRLVYDGSSSFRAHDSHVPNFEIDRISYRFDQTGLSYQDTNGSFRRVTTYLSLLDQLSIYQDDTVAIQPESNLAPPNRRPSLSKIKIEPDVDSPTKDKIEVLSPEFKSNSLYKGLQGGQLSWSPSSSQTDSPMVGTTTSNHQSPRAPSVFLVTQPEYIQPRLIAHTQQRIITIPQRATATDQRTRKRGTKDHLICPECGKECRRPVALKEHLRSHFGQKPEVCPFTSCNTGFATKSNMRRHFLTHRAGTLEDYVSSGSSLFDTIPQGLNQSENPTPPGDHHTNPGRKSPRKPGQAE